MASEQTNESIYDFSAIEYNKDGWGPMSSSKNFDVFPFGLFARDENLGMIVDVTQDVSQKPGGTTAGDNSFVVVDTTHASTPRKNKLLHNKPQKNYNNQSMQYNQANAKYQKKKYISNYNNNRKFDMNQAPSILIKSNWKSIVQVDFSDLLKLSTKEIPTPSDIAVCGSYGFYNEQMDASSPKKPITLNTYEDSSDMKVRSVMEDPFITHVATEKVATVYATDMALAYLMLATRSNNPWDLEVIKNEKGIFLSHRSGIFDLLSVNETSGESLTEEEMKDDCIRKEATAVNRDFLKEITSGKAVDCKFPTPFEEERGEEKIHKMYRYRKYPLEGENALLLRTEVHGAQKKGENTLFFNAYAVNEWSSKNPAVNRWRSKLEGNAISVFTENMKNNYFRLSKWGLQAKLAGVDQVKMGFVSRRNLDDAKSGHVILDIESYSLDIFTKQILLSERNMWAVVNYFVKLLSKQEDGKYVIMKEPGKGMLRIYNVPSEDKEIGEKEKSSSEYEYSSSYSSYSSSEGEDASE